MNHSTDLMKVHWGDTYMDVLCSDAVAAGTGGTMGVHQGGTEQQHVVAGPVNSGQQPETMNYMGVQLLS